MADTEDTDTPAVESRVIIEIDEHPQLVGATGTIKKFSSDGTTAWVETGPSRGVWCSVSNLRVIPPDRGGVMADTEDTETLTEAERARVRILAARIPEVGADLLIGYVQALLRDRAAARDERIRADEREKLDAGMRDALTRGPHLHHDREHWVGLSYVLDILDRLAGEVEAR